VNHWPFVIASYVIVLGGTFALIVASWRTMKSAEARVDEVVRK
jgi:hypothetical protein